MTQTPSLNEIKKELSLLSSSELMALCLRLAKHYKENKELLAYLIFELHNEDGFIAKTKQEIDKSFANLPMTTHLLKKALRKILKVTNKYIKFSGNKQTEVELRIYFCSQMRVSGLLYYENKVINSLYDNQIIKIEKAISKLHDDLQYDYRKLVQDLESIHS